MADSTGFSEMTSNVSVKTAQAFCQRLLTACAYLGAHSRYLECSSIAKDFVHIANAGSTSK